MLFRVSSEPPLHGAGSNVEEMNAFSGELPLRGAVEEAGAESIRFWRALAAQG